MTARLTDFIFACIERALSRRSPHRVGVVTSYDPATHSVKLIRQPEGVELTGFSAIGTGMAANNYGFVLGPDVGDQFVLGHINGDIEIPFVAGRLFSDQDKPPVVQGGEALMKAKTQARVFMDQDGKITIDLSDGTSIVWSPGMILAVNPAGVKVRWDTDGTLWARPAPGKFVMLGADKTDSGATFGKVQTDAGVSINVKARVA